MYDVAVIGGGVIGGTILRKLSEYNASVVMLEKETDVCMGASKANSGIVHAGFDAPEGSYKAKFNVLGNAMMKRYAKELGVKYKNNGSLVVAFDEEEKQTLYALLERGKRGGVKKLKVISAKKLKKLEPNVSDGAVAALYAKTGGIVCPYELTIAAIGNAMDNGAKLKLGFCVTEIEKFSDYFIIRSTDGRSITARIIINCAGAESGKIASLCGDDSVKIGLRRGEYLLLDRETPAAFHSLFFTPTAKGKGILVSPTVDGNTILGPTADEIPEFSVDTTAKGLEKVIEKAHKMAKCVPLYNTITSFAGVRAYSKDRHDFIIEKSSVTEGLVNVCGIESPGLTSAPAIAEYVVNNLVPHEITAIHNPCFIKKRRPDFYFKTLSDKEKNALIKKDPRFGKVVCRCECITEGEIVSAIRSNPPARTIDAVKRRTRSGMGRCQGGFCSPRVAEILAHEMNVPLTEVIKSGKNSKIVIGKNK